MPADVKLVRDCFLAAAELPVAERAAYLTAHCGGDGELRAAVERLLAAHEQPASALEPGPKGLEPTSASLASERPGNLIAGRYKLLQQIGEGGMGSVWMADQTEPVKRRVAVKLIRVERGNSKMILSRFEAERQAIALMDHPHIAKLLDAGTTQVGQPYFVMELVKGVPLTEYCDAHKLSIRERLVLFQQICSAVQHAHQKGIIHRDLKPTNILVESHDGKPVPKVIDFGLAKAATGMQLTEHTLFTAFGNVMGTPTYMAPEQAAFNAVDVDTRADVYSLGVILYELLTGTTPITRETVKKAAIDEMLKLIREQEAPKPSSRLTSGGSVPGIAANRSIDPAKLSKLLRGDLDWVVLKALEKDRKRRYETANGLAADIERHLLNEPVLARPPSATYRLQKAWQRNKLAFIAGLTIAASLLTGIAVSMWQTARANAALNELRATAPAFAEQARGLAAKEQFAEAIEKLQYAAKLRPDQADYLNSQGDLLQCQLRLTDAAKAYRAALALRRDDAHARTNAELCDELLAATPGENGQLTRESLSKLQMAMERQRRPPGEVMPVARLLGEEKKLVVAYWEERLKDLPLTVRPDMPLGLNLQVREDGLLALYLGNTNIADLKPLVGMPLGTLDLTRCKQIEDFAPLSEMRSLTELNLSDTGIDSLAPLRGLPLVRLDLTDTEMFDISDLQGMKLVFLHLRNTRVSDLSPLAGMPLVELDTTGIPASDYSPLAGAPLERLFVQNSPIRELSFLRGSPIEELTLFRCNQVRGFAVLKDLESLNLLILPSNYRDLPDEELAAIGDLRGHPSLKNIEDSEGVGGRVYRSIQSKDAFWEIWDREQPFTSALRNSGYVFSLTRLANGTYNLSIENQPVSDLSFLADAPISELWLNRCKVADLSPLENLPLRVLGLHGNPVRDITPLSKLPLEELSLEYTQVSDLAPIAHLPLKKLYLHNCDLLLDIAALAEIPTLEKLTVPVLAQNIERLRAHPNLKLLAFGMSPDRPYLPVSTTAQFWDEYEKLGWLRALHASGIKPKFQNRTSDGTWDVDLSKTELTDLSVLRGAPLRLLWIHETSVSDLEPLRGIPLQELHLYNTKVTDLRPLEGMPIKWLNLVSTKVADLTPLRGMPLKSLKLNNCLEVVDLSPLEDIKTLTHLTLPYGAQNIDFLRTFPHLERLSYFEDESNAFRPTQTAAEFWKERDAAMQ
jgi:eukaryotic-like serine/threonine-protein kinase